MLFFPLSESDKAPHYIYPSNPNGSKLQTVTITMWVIQALAQCSPRRYLMSNTYDYLWYFLENLVMLSKTVYAFLQRKGLYTPRNRFLITSKNMIVVTVLLLIRHKPNSVWFIIDKLVHKFGYNRFLYMFSTRSRLGFLSC